VVEAALRELGWQGHSILSAGRTDTGVHALGQVIAFDLDWAHTPEELQAALNSLLPPSVSAHSAQPVQVDFHPRYNAWARCYCYYLFCQEVRHPLRERYAWRVWPAVDLDRMSIAARALQGRHDFAAFGSPPRTGGSTVRTIFDACWIESRSPWGDLELVFRVSGDAFLYRMVRRLVSIQVEIGQGRLEPEKVSEFLNNPTLNPVQGLAPPNGLVLVSVSYPV
jgi:tRNA pseudouridine38-40 synthase